MVRSGVDKEEISLAFFHVVASVQILPHIRDKDTTYFENFFLVGKVSTR